MNAPFSVCDNVKSSRLPKYVSESGTSAPFKCLYRTLSHQIVSDIGALGVQHGYVLKHCHSFMRWGPMHYLQIRQQLVLDGFQTMVCRSFMAFGD